jgi:hypothetical protein
MRFRHALFASTFAVLVAGAASAQDAAPRPAPPQQPNPEQTIPERVAPPATPTPATPPVRAPRDESLTERLDRTDGVLAPPGNAGRNMPVITPPDPGTTPVIPPPPPGATPQR